jgi:hypothetical protein
MLLLLLLVALLMLSPLLLLVLLLLLTMPYCTAYCPLLAVQVSDAGGAAALSCLLQLRVLDLSCSTISSRGLLLLAPLQHLYSLNLDMCHIGDKACRVRRGGRGCTGF